MPKGGPRLPSILRNASRQARGHGLVCACGRLRAASAGLPAGRLPEPSCSRAAMLTLAAGEIAASLGLLGESAKRLPEEAATESAQPAQLDTRAARRRPRRVPGR